MLQRGLKGLSNRPAAVMQGGPVDRSILVAVPVVKHLLLQAQQLQGSLEVRQNSVLELVLASPAVPEGP